MRPLPSTAAAVALRVMSLGATASEAAAISRMTESEVKALDWSDHLDAWRANYGRRASSYREAWLDQGRGENISFWTVRRDGIAARYCAGALVSQIASERGAPIEAVMAAVALDCLHCEPKDEQT